MAKSKQPASAAGSTDLVIAPTTTTPADPRDRGRLLTQIMSATQQLGLPGFNTIQADEVVGTVGRVSIARLWYDPENVIQYTDDYLDRVADTLVHDAGQVTPLVVVPFKDMRSFKDGGTDGDLFVIFGDVYVRAAPRRGVTQLNVVELPYKNVYQTFLRNANAIMLFGGQEVDSYKRMQLIAQLRAAYAYSRQHEPEADIGEFPTQEQMGLILNCSQGEISTVYALLDKLDPQVRQMLDTQQLSFTAARELVRLPPADQLGLAQRIVGAETPPTRAELRQTVQQHRGIATPTQPTLASSTPSAPSRDDAVNTADTADEVDEEGDADAFAPTFVFPARPAPGVSQDMVWSDDAEIDPDHLWINIWLDRAPLDERPTNGRMAMMCAHDLLFLIEHMVGQGMTLSWPFQRLVDALRDPVVRRAMEQMDPSKIVEATRS